MTNKKATSQPNNQPTQPAKKIQKQRQRILKELEEAQQAQAEALERFHRAESRLQKRTAELQRVAAQLLLIQQQLGEPAGPIPLAAAMPGSERVQDDLSVGADPARPSPQRNAAEHVSILRPSEPDEQEPSAIHRPAATQDAQEPSPPTQTSTSGAESSDEFPTVGQHPVQISEVPNVVESVEDEFPAATQHTDEATVSPTEPPQASQEPATLLTQSEQPIEAPSVTTETDNIVSQESLSPTQAAEFAREARAVAEVAEQAARLAAERAAAAAAHLDQAGSGSRHLLNELQQLQNEAEQADAVAQAATRSAQEAEAQAQQLAPESTNPGADKIQSNAPSSIHPDAGGTSISESTDDETTLDQPNTATMIAGVAAAAAAQAEAIAEASSARTREARRLAHQADQVLNDARAAMHSGIWSGEDAEQYLQTLEKEATRAHAILADAEAAEEQARRAASNAEVEAEVAEDLAFTTNNQAQQNDNV